MKNVNGFQKMVYKIKISSQIWKNILEFGKNVRILKMMVDLKNIHGYEKNCQELEKQITN